MFMLQNTKKINKIIAIAWAVALAAGIISAIYQGLANTADTVQSSTALSTVVSSALASVVLLFIILIVIANIKYRQLLKFPLYQTVGLAAFAVTTPVAIILSSPTLNGSSLTATLSAQLLTLSFIPYILFICQLTKQSNLPKIIFCALAAVNFLAQNIVGLAGIMPMTDLLRLSYAVIIICLLYTFYAVWHYRQNNTWYYNKLATAIMLFAFCTLAEVLTSSESKILILLGFTLFTAVIYWLSQQNIIETLQAETADRIMHEHALLDSQTGFGSRLAFDEYYYDLGKTFGGTVSISIMVIDLNNLKDTNDKYGHQAGD